METILEKTKNNETLKSYQKNPIEWKKLSWMQRDALHGVLRGTILSKEPEVKEAVKYILEACPIPINAYNNLLYDICDYYDRDEMKEFLQSLEKASKSK